MRDDKGNVKVGLKERIKNSWEINSSWHSKNKSMNVYEELTQTINRHRQRETSIAFPQGQGNNSENN